MQKYIIDIIILWFLFFFYQIFATIIPVLYKLNDKAKKAATDLLVNGEEKKTGPIVLLGFFFWLNVVNGENKITNGKAVEITMTTMTI